MEKFGYRKYNKNFSKRQKIIMQTETEKIFAEQLEKLPPEVIDFLSSADWGNDLKEIGTLYNLSAEEIATFKMEVSFVLSGLVHPDDFKETLGKEIGMGGEFLDILVSATEQKIFASIRPALLAFFEKEDAEDSQENQNLPTQTEQKETASDFIDNLGVQLPSKAMVWNKTPDTAPDNLPTGEEGLFLPNLTPKSSNLGVELPSDAGSIESVQPFEEKMRRVFTVGQQSIDDLSLITPERQAVSPQNTNPSRIYHADPYREDVE